MDILVLELGLVGLDGGCRGNRAVLPVGLCVVVSHLKMAKRLRWNVRMEH